MKDGNIYIYICIEKRVPLFIIILLSQAASVTRSMRAKVGGKLATNRHFYFLPLLVPNPFRFIFIFLVFPINLLLFLSSYHLICMYIYIGDIHLQKPSITIPFCILQFSSNTKRFLFLCLFGLAWFGFFLPPCRSKEELKRERDL